MGLHEFADYGVIAVSGNTIFEWNEEDGARVKGLVPTAKPAAAQRRLCPTPTTTTG